MPTTAELTQARLFLQNASVSTQWVLTLLHADEPAAAARLNDIVIRLEDEMCAIDRLIAAKPQRRPAHTKTRASDYAPARPMRPPSAQSSRPSQNSSLARVAERQERRHSAARDGWP